MKRRILLVDDDLAVLLTLKAVLELHEFEVDTAVGTAEAFARMESGVYHMVISDLHMETENAGLEVIRAAHRQSYAPATALLTAIPPSDEHWDGRGSSEEGSQEKDSFGDGSSAKRPAEDRPDSLLVKPVGTSDLVRQIEALLIRHADKQELLQRITASRTQLRNRSAG
ncbi:MAG: response regulator [Terriglobales bacterium]|jgi:DNA-binding response OmpR family regulator